MLTQKLRYGFGRATSGESPAPPWSSLLWYSSRNVDGLNNSSMIDGQQVGTWVNAGTLGAAWNLTQATAGLRPLWNAVGSAGKMGNKPAVAYDGTKFMATATGLALQSQRLFWIVVSGESGTGIQTYFGGVGGNAHALIANTLALQIYSGLGPVASGQSTTAGAIQTITFTANGATSGTSVDGSPGSNANSGAVGVDNLIYGANGAGLNKLIGPTYEVFLVDGASAPSLAAVNSWVASVYGATPQ